MKYKSEKQVKTTNNKEEMIQNADKNEENLKVELKNVEKMEVEEYENDSSDEEDLRNTIGNIPINWYDEYEHIGYGLDSLPIKKPKKKDALDKLLERLENPDHGRTILDKQTGQEVKLSDKHIDLLLRLMSNRVPDSKYDAYAPFHDIFSHEVMKMPLSGRTDPKRNFCPSIAERKKVARLANLMIKGIKIQRSIVNRKVEKYYDIWRPRTEDDKKIKGITDYIKAPKLRVPGHSLSYNPPPEYLMSKKDMTKLKEGQKSGSKSGLNKEWKRFRTVRNIPAYPKTMRECFFRCAELYTASRKKIEKVVATSKDFLPKLPDKKDLRPYPTLEALRFEGHRSIVRSISIHPAGKYLASGSDDHTIKIWEISTSRCICTFNVEHVPKKVAWNPNPKLFLLAVAMGHLVVFINPENYLTNKTVIRQSNAIFKEEIDQGDYLVMKRIEAAAKWRQPTPDEWSKGYRIVIEHFKEVSQVAWHKQGDYFASLIPEGIHRSVIIHQLSRNRSQMPFRKSKGRVQAIAFHPKEPLLFVATQAHIKLYSLQRQALKKKIHACSRYLSCIAVHPGGEHFLVGGYDRRLNWFEMECTKRPHLMRVHRLAVRGIAFHRKYPMYATCSDDKVIVTHAMVFDDFITDPLIVPLKYLKGHRKFDKLYVLDVAWHPFEPYLFTAGADSTIRLWN